MSETNDRELNDYIKLTRRAKIPNYAVDFFVLELVMKKLQGYNTITINFSPQNLAILKELKNANLLDYRVEVYDDGGDVLEGVEKPRKKSVSLFI